jgi:hypothetical protein
VIFVLFLFMCSNKFIDLHVLNHPFIPGMKPTRSWCLIVLMCCWVQLASICLIIFASNWTRMLVYNSLFFVVSLSSFQMSVILFHRSLVAFLPFLFHVKVWGILVLVFL